MAQQLERRRKLRQSRFLSNLRPLSFCDKCSHERPVFDGRGAKRNACPSWFDLANDPDNPARDIWKCDCDHLINQTEPYRICSKSNYRSLQEYRAVKTLLVDVWKGIGQDSVAEIRTFQETHPWIDFQLDLRKVDYTLWFQLGEAQAKCEQISGVHCCLASQNTCTKFFLREGRWQLPRLKATLCRKKML